MSNRKKISLELTLEECKKESLSVISKKNGIRKSSICTLTNKNKRKIGKNLKITNNGTKNRQSIKKRKFTGMKKAILPKKTGEKLSGRQDLVEPFRNHFQTVVSEQNLTRDAIFNADETDLYWKLLPDKTLVHAEESSGSGRKLSKERVTVLLCANASGSKKLKPLLIRKAKKLCSLKKQVNPTNYTHSKNASMNLEIFKMWFFEMFVPEVEEFLKSKNLPIKALLIIDNAPSHPPAEDLVKTTKDGKIWTLYLPANVTPLIQPMEQNAIRILKINYRNNLLSKIIALKTEIIVDFLKNLNLDDAANMINLAWKNIKKECLESCWNKIISTDSQYKLEDAKIRFIRRSVRLLSTAFPNITFNIEDVSNWNEDIIQDADIEDEDNECDVIPVESEEVIIKHSAAIKAFETCIIWCDQNRIDVSKSLVLRELKKEAKQKGVQNTLKQSLMTDFLRK